MNNLIYYGIRLGLLSLIILLGLIAYAPETLELSGAWSGAHEKSDYIAETEIVKQVSKNEMEQADSEMMIDAINQGLKNTEYVFSKNRFRPYNQRGWWPPILSTAIETKQADVFNYFLSQGYHCDYSNVTQGLPAFKAAISSSDSDYLITLLASDCDTTAAPLRASLDELIKNSEFPERLKYLSN